MKVTKMGAGIVASLLLFTVSMMSLNASSENKVVSTMYLNTKEVELLLSHNGPMVLLNKAALNLFASYADSRNYSSSTSLKNCCDTVAAGLKVVAFDDFTNALNKVATTREHKAVSTDLLQNLEKGTLHFRVQTCCDRSKDKLVEVDVYVCKAPSELKAIQYVGPSQDQILIGNVEIAGNLIVDGGEQILGVLTVSNDAYISGDLTMGCGSTIYVNEIDPTDCSDTTTFSGNVFVSGDLEVDGVLFVDNCIAGFFCEASDKSIKTDVASIDSKENLENVLKLNPVTYKFIKEWKGVPVDEQETQRGLIAQEVKAVLPEVVQVSPRTVNGKVIDEFHSLDYARLTVELIGAVQELNKKIEQMKADATKASNDKPFWKQKIDQIVGNRK